MLKRGDSRGLELPGPSKQKRLPACSVVVFAALVAWVMITGCGSGDGDTDGGQDVGSQADAGHADATNPDATSLDARADAGPEEIGPGPDTGPVDGGGCGCSYGYHHECPQGQTCQLGYGSPVGNTAPTMCISGPPAVVGVGGACTSTAGQSQGACNAQCVSMDEGSPCRAVSDTTGMARAIQAWYRAIGSAAFDASGGGFMDHALVEQALTSGMPTACNEFIAWTVLGLFELCGGLRWATHPLEWRRSGDWNWSMEERKLTQTATGTCRARAAGACAGELAGAIDFRSLAPLDNLALIRDYCPEGLPTAAPCQGPNAIACIQGRVGVIARSLYHFP